MSANPEKMSQTVKRTVLAFIALAMISTMLGGCSGDEPPPAAEPEARREAPPTPSSRPPAARPSEDSGPVQPSDSGPSASGESAAGPSDIPPAGNRPPVVESVAFEPDPPQTGGSVRVVPKVSDPDGDEVNLSYAWTVNGQPVEDAAGDVLERPLKEGDVLQVEIRADDLLEEVTEQFEVTVSNGPPRLRLVGQQIREGAYEARLEASDPEGEPLDWVLEEGPEGMAVDAAGSVLRWPVPDNVQGTFPIRVTAKDPAGNEAYLQWTIDIGWRQGEEGEGARGED